MANVESCKIKVVIKKGGQKIEKSKDCVGLMCLRFILKKIRFHDDIVRWYKFH